MKIQVKKSPTADTRSAKEPVSIGTLLESSIQHISDVNSALRWMSLRLNQISVRHDWTKIDGIDQFHTDFEAVQIGKEKDFCALPWYQRHITEERHHLDKRVPDDVNLFDVLERIADITTAGMARTGKVFDDTIDPAMLEKAYKNTVEMIKNHIVVEN